MVDFVNIKLSVRFVKRDLAAHAALRGRAAKEGNEEFVFVAIKLIFINLGKVYGYYAVFFFGFSKLIIKCLIYRLGKGGGIH